MTPKKACSLLALTLAACANAPAPNTPPAAKAAQGSRREEAEVVTGSRIPVRGAQPVRTIDKEEIMRDSRVIGVPSKGN